MSRLSNLRAAAHRVRQLFDPPRPDPWRPASLVERGVVRVGRRSYPAVPNVVCHGGDTAGVTIGAFCSIADGVEFVPGGNHLIDSATTFPVRTVYGLPDPHRNGHPWSKGDITVGNDVWIGRAALVLGGVNISDGAVVAAGSVVTKDVARYAIVGGVPAKPIGRRMTDEQGAVMQGIGWWYWPDELIVERADDLEGAAVDDFIARYGRAGWQAESP